MNARTTALLLVGFENDKYAPNGLLRRMVDSTERIDASLARALQFVRTVAAIPMLVISTPIAFDPAEASTTKPRGILAAIRDMGALQRGTWGAEPIAELAEFSSVITTIPNRRGFNAFTDTGLHEILAERGVRTVLIAGNSTGLCVDTTGRTAAELGYDVTILTDCIYGRTFVEDRFYIDQIFPLYANTATSTNVLEQLQASLGE
ncbi:MAG: cysteine hydrolase [bacterium]